MSQDIIGVSEQEIVTALSEEIARQKVYFTLDGHSRQRRQLPFITA